MIKFFKKQKPNDLSYNAAFMILPYYIITYNKERIQAPFSLNKYISLQTLIIIQFFVINVTDVT